MKNLKNKALACMMLFAVSVFGVGCQAEHVADSGEDLLKDEVQNPELKFQLYTVGNSALLVGSHLSFIERAPEMPNDPFPICGVDVNLQDLKLASERVQYNFGERKIVTTPLSSTRIVGIDVITNADYDDAHLAGSSLADIMELDYIGDDGRYYSTMDLTDYFTTHSGLDIKVHQVGQSITGFIFRLSAKTTPLEKNWIKRTDLARYSGDYLLAVDLTLVLTLEDGTVVKVTDIIPGFKV